jgi:threonine dehydratase
MAAEVSLDDVLAARDFIAPHVHRTPIFSSETLSLLTGTSIRLKAENLQKTGAFKVRGATNAVGRLDPASRARGVIGISAGNHGMGLAHAARLTGSSATVVMPEGASATKVAAIESYGGHPVLFDGKRLMECMETIRDRDGLTFIHPFDNPHVIAGQGTVGLEIVEDVPDLDAVIVPVGGGGLLSGVAIAVKAQRPNAIVIGVEPEGSTAVSQSLAAGRPLRLDAFNTVADGLNAPWSGPTSLAIIQRLVDEVVTVSDAQMIEALALILQRAKLLVEPAGAAAVAALLSGKLTRISGKRVVAILSGGNVDQARLSEFLAS